MDTREKWLAKDVQIAMTALIASGDLDATDLSNLLSGRGISQRARLLVKDWMHANERQVQAEIAKTEEELEAIFAKEGIKRRRAQGWKRPAEWSF